MAVQTSVSTDFVPAVEGGVRTCEMTRTRYAQVALNNGLFVCQGTDDNQCTLPASAAAVLKGLGVAPYKASAPVGFPFTQTTEYAAGDTVGAVSRGEVWVRVEEAVTPFSPVFVRYAAGNGGRVQLGAFRASDDPTAGPVSTAAQIPGARYLTSAAPGALALLDLNLPSGT